MPNYAVLSEFNYLSISDLITEFHDMSVTNFITILTFIFNKITERKHGYIRVHHIT